MLPEFVCDDVFRLETKRLWLRWPQMGDAPALGRHAGDKAVAEMTGRIPWPYPDGAAARFIADVRARNAQRRSLGLVMAEKNAPDAIIGSIGVEFDRGAPLLGYWVARPLWGRGMATEAAQAVIDFAFTFSDIAEIAATARVINPASRRVLEKCGFAYMGSGLEHLLERGGMVSCDRFHLDRKAWVSLKSWRMPGLAQRRPPAPSEVGCPA